MYNKYTLPYYNIIVPITFGSTKKSNFRQAVMTIKGFGNTIKKSILKEIGNANIKTNIKHLKYCKKFSEHVSSKQKHYKKPLS